MLPLLPIPKESPATISKLRSIPVTAHLAKVCEGFVSKWALEDMSIDRNQYGSIKGSSTTHCLIELLVVLYRGTDKCNTVGSLVVTDFPKAFDCVDPYSCHQKFEWNWCESWNHSLDCRLPYISSPESAVPVCNFCMGNAHLWYPPRH